MTHHRRPSVVKPGSSAWENVFQGELVFSENKFLKKKDGQIMKFLPGVGNVFTVTKVIIYFQAWNNTILIINISKAEHRACRYAM